MLQLKDRVFTKIFGLVSLVNEEANRERRHARRSWRSRQKESPRAA